MRRPTEEQVKYAADIPAYAKVEATIRDTYGDRDLDDPEVLVAVVDCFPSGTDWNVVAAVLHGIYLDWRPGGEMLEYAYGRAKSGKWVY
jgi:hypothetical protein